MVQNEYEMQSPPRVPPKTVPQPNPPNEEALPSSARSSITAREPVTTTFGINLYPLLIVGSYTTIALLAWILVCIMSKRPIRLERSYYKSDTYHPERAYAINEKYMKVAQILRSVVALLTVPVTSAICSMAAVAYMQAGNLRKSLDVRRAMAIADQGWISPRIWVLLPKTGSSLLYLAFVLTLIGSISQILQDAFVKEEAIKAGSYNSYLQYVRINDIPDMLNETAIGLNRGEQIFRLRSLLDVVTQDDYDANLWNQYSRQEERKLGIFANGLITASDHVEDTFLSQLPFNFSTGISPAQYAPRISSKTSYDQITDSDFRNGCRNDTDNGGFYAAYEITDDYGSYTSVTACMLGDKRISPWKATRDRQDITEELYINFTSYKKSQLLRAITNTTLGYFELPNYANGNRPGPILDKDPIEDKSSQTGRLRTSKRETVNLTYAGNETLPSTNNPGPLTALALALFGNGSFIEIRLRNPSAFNQSRPAFDGDTRRRNTGICVGLEPFGSYLSSGPNCIFDYNSILGGFDQVESWLSSLVTSVYDFEGSIAVGTFLANKLWLGTRTRYGYDRNLRITYDEGIDTIKPKISRGQMIAGSFFLAIHLFGLWILATYTVFMRPWADNMGAEVMVRLGTSYADKLGDTSQRDWKRTLGELPGYIGDARPNEGIGRLQFGAGASLRGTRSYEVLR